MPGQTSQIRRLPHGQPKMRGHQPRRQNHDGAVKTKAGDGVQHIRQPREPLLGKRGGDRHGNKDDTDAGKDDHGDQHIKQAEQAGDIPPSRFGDTIGAVE